MTGTLLCKGCAYVYPVVRGVPRMNAGMEGLERVAQTFSFEWGAHHAGKLEESGTLWGLTLDDDWAYFKEATCLNDEELEGKIVLDAGCGSGRLTRQISEHGAATVIGVDMIDAVDGAFERSRELPNVHIVQGNIFELPLRARSFDLVWSTVSFITRRMHDVRTRHSRTWSSPKDCSTSGSMQSALTHFGLPRTCSTSCA